MTTAYARDIHYIQSAAFPEQLPPEVPVEIAFAGRSNAGKSSAINAITGVKHLAKTSKTPGRTQCINFFWISHMCRFVDLPGYGYANVAAATKARWQGTLRFYLQHRSCLRGLVLVSDIRNPLKDSDRELMTWATCSFLPVHILLTKSDKLSKHEIQSTLSKVRALCLNYPNSITVQAFSSLRSQGIDEARMQLRSWEAMQTL